MQQQVYIELNQLALEFQRARKSCSNKYPQDIWRQAIFLAKKLSVEEVSEVLHIAPAYLYKKIKDLTSNTKPIRFIEAVSQPSTDSSSIVISIETSVGQMKIEGVTDDSLRILMSEFFRGGSSCSR